MRGYGGRILFVDAGSGRSRVEPVSEPMARSLIGGNGFAARPLLDHVPPRIDAYHAANAVLVPVPSPPPAAAPPPPPTKRPPVFHPSGPGGRGGAPVPGRAPERGAAPRPARDLW